MNWLDAIILGVIEGLTEFLPVSSTGHLLLAQRLMGIPESALNNAYTISIQLGAILAVLTLYKDRFFQLVRGIFGGDKGGRKLLLNLLIAFLPAAIVGILFDSVIEEYLFNLPAIAVAWFVGGLAILMLRRKTGDKTDGKTAGKLIGDLSYKQALVIGLIQCLAMWPGVSRSLATILGGLWIGLTLSAAIEFSFLLGVITLSAASLFKIVQYGGALLSTYSPTILITGLLASWITAVLAVKWMIKYLEHKPLTLFAVWRIALAVIVVIYLAI